MSTLKPLDAPAERPQQIPDTVSAEGPTEPRPGSGAWTWLALAVVFAVGVGLRLVHLGHTFWGDEQATVRLLRQPLLHMVRHGIPDGESTPPLYYVIAWVWTHVFGTSEVGVRSLSALIGVATIAVAYPLGLELRGRRAGLLLAAFVAVSPFAIWFSQEARAYGLAILLVTVGLLFFARATRTASRKDLWLWAAASACALVTHYFTIFVVAPEAVLLLALNHTRRRAVWPTVLPAATLVAMVPLLLFQRSHGGHLSWIGFVSVGSWLKMTLQFFETASWTVDFALLAAATAGLAAVIALAFASRRIGRREWMIIGVGVAAIVLPALFAIAGFNYLNYSNLVVAWMPFVAVLTVAIVSWRRVGAVLAALLLAASLAASVKIQTTSALQRPDWRLATKTLAAQPPGSLFVMYPAADLGTLAWYDRQVSVVNSDGLLPADPRLRVVRTRRIEILGWDPFVNDAAGTLRFRPPPGFRETGRRLFSTFVLVSYTAAHTQPVQVSALTSSRRSGYLLGHASWPSAVFFQSRPGSSGYGSAAG